MIKNIIFDVGKVLIDWNPKSTMKELGFSEKDIDEIYDAIFDSGAWSEEDRGVISHEKMYDYLAGFCPEHESQIKLFYDHAIDSATLMPYTHEWISSLKSSGYKVYILSNFGEFAWNGAILKGAIDFLDMTDGRVVSYEIKHIKPEPEIFMTLMSKYNLIPEECVFLDDSQKNIDGAKAMGINAILFTDYSDAIAKLKELGVK